MAKGSHAKLVLPACIFGLVLLGTFVFVFGGFLKPNASQNFLATESTEELVQRRERMLLENPVPNMFTLEVEKLDLSDSEIRRIAEYYRDLYPFESLRERLSYENELSESRPQPILGEKARARLNTKEKPTGLFISRLVSSERRRSKTLAMLHTDHVNDFISRNGFGFERFPPLPLKDLRLTQVELVPYDQSESKTTSKIDALNELLPESEPGFYDLLGKKKFNNLDDKKAYVKMQYEQWINASNPLRFPTMPRLVKIHDDNNAAFSGYKRTGHVENIDHVIGFMPHAVTVAARPKMSFPPEQFPETARNVGDDDPAKRVWLVTQMQLVSLLKFGVPRVYESKNLPNMDELADASTRELNEFEIDAFKDLKAGKDIVTRATTNRLQMLGSLRAAKQCLQCHSVRRGELLGAFTYELTRKHPVASLNTTADVAE